MSDQDVDDVFGEFEETSYSPEKNDLYLKNGEIDTANEKRSTTDKPLETTKTRKLVRSLQLKLDPNRVCGPRGIPAVIENFKQVKLEGKGHEKSDLDIILSQMEHWAHRLFPKLPFDDCVENVAKLGNTKAVQVYIKRFRMGMLDTEPQISEAVVNTDVQFDSITERGMDEFNAMLSLPSQLVAHITEDQQRRMAENKQRAEDKRQSRLMQNISHSINSCSNETSTSKILPNLNSTSPEITEINQNNLEILDVDMFLESLP